MLTSHKNLEEASQELGSKDAFGHTSELRFLIVLNKYHPSNHSNFSLMLNSSTKYDCVAKGPINKMKESYYLG